MGGVYRAAPFRVGDDSVGPYRSMLAATHGDMV